MAVDQEAVVEHMATRIVQATDQWVGAVMELRNLQEWRDEAGIAFNDFESLFGENASNALLQHVEGAYLNKITGVVLGADSSTTDSIMHHLENTTVSGGPLDGETYWAVIQLIRRNGT